jgi:hypothetical protein
MRIVRVFPRRTKATPDDRLAFVGKPPLLLPEADEVRVSCTFTWDKPKAERLAQQWSRHFGKVSLGGPAYDAHGDNFIPGLYLKQGYVITTRGCPNHCSFCMVPRREGSLRCLSVAEGWDVLDNNLLAASKEHIASVFRMLSRQKKAARFTGGLEAKRIDDWFIQQLSTIRVHSLFLAYDRPIEKDYVENALGLLHSAGYSRSKVYCYVLCGYDGDTIEQALERVSWVKDMGACPFAMYFRSIHSGPDRPEQWARFIRDWIRPALIYHKEKPPHDSRRSLI